MRNAEIEEALKIKQGLYKKVTEFLHDFDLQKYQNLQNDINAKKSELADYESKVDKLNDNHDDIINKEKLLNEIPCGTSYPTCRFIRDAHVAVANKSLVEQQQRETLLYIEQAQASIDELTRS